MSTSEVDKNTPAFRVDVTCMNSKNSSERRRQWLISLCRAANLFIPSGPR
jgi:hypothetical protein